MSPSGAEVLRQIKSRIDEVDPAAVREQVSNGAVVVDVREPEEWAAGHIPGAKHVPKSYLESRIEGAVPDRDAARDPLLRVRQPLGVGGADAARGPRLRARRVDDRRASRCGRTAATRSRSPRTLTRRAARALLAPPAAARGRPRGPAEAARREGAAAGRRRARLAGGAVPGRGRRRHARDRRQRRGRPLEPPAPGDPLDRADRRAEGRLGRADDQRAQPGREGREVPGPARPREHHGDPARLRRRRRRPRQLPDPLPAQRRLGAAAGSRSCRPRSSASRASCRCSSPTTGPCYRCLFPVPPPAELAPSCGANGVLGVLPGTMGLLQATEVIKLILGEGDPLIGRLLMYDALAASFTEVKVRRDPRVPDLLAAIPRRSPTRRWACSPTTRRSAPARTRVPQSMATIRIPPVLRPVGRRREGADRRSGASVGEILRSVAESHPDTAVAAVRGRRRAQPLRQRLPQRRGRARARRARHVGRRRATRS